MLQLLGIVFLVVLGLALVSALCLVVWYHRVSHRCAVTLALEEGIAESELPVLVPTSDSGWYHLEEAEAQHSRLMALDCQIVDDFVVPAVDDVRVRGYCSTEPSAYIALYDHPQAGCWLDLVMLAEDGSSQTISSVPDIGRGAPRAPQHPITFIEENSHPATLLGFARSAVHDTPVRLVTAATFVADFNAMSKAGHDYVSRADIDQAWLETIAESVDVSLSGDEAEQINSTRQMNRYVETFEACLHSFAASCGMTAAQWERVRHQFIVVFDDAPADVLVDEFLARLDDAGCWDAEDATVEALVKMADAPLAGRELAAQLNATLPEPMSFVLLGSITEPVAADFYLPAELRAA